MHLLFTIVTTNNFKIVFNYFLWMLSNSFVQFIAKLTLLFVQFDLNVFNYLCSTYHSTYIFSIPTVTVFVALIILLKISDNGISLVSFD